MTTTTNEKALEPKELPPLEVYDDFENFAVDIERERIPNPDHSEDFLELAACGRWAKKLTDEALVEGVVFLNTYTLKSKFIFGAVVVEIGNRLRAIKP